MEKLIIQRVTALSGILSAFMAALVIYVAGYYQPEYSHIQNFISELNASESKHGSVVGFLGFLPVGILTLLFISRLKQELVWSTRVAVGLCFLSFSGIDWLVTATFPCDVGCPSTGDTSLSQTIHNLSGLFTALLAPTGVFLLIKPLKQAQFSKAVIIFSIFSIVSSVISFILFISSSFVDLFGLIQRCNFFIFYMYLSVLSLNTYKKSINPNP